MLSTTTFLRIGALYLTLAVMAVTAQGSQALDVKPLYPVVNKSGLNDYVLTQYALPAGHVVALNKPGRALFVNTDFFRSSSGQIQCFAVVGPVLVDSKAKATRYPSERSSGFTFADAGIDAHQCQADAFRAAMAGLSTKSVDEILKGLDKTAVKGGERSTVKKRLGRVEGSFLGGLTNVDRQAILDVVPDEFGRHFDYRHTTLRVVSESFTFDSGQVGCYAQVGVTARNPDGRNPYFPAFLATATHVTSKPAHCELEVAILSMRLLMNSPWDASPSGILHNIEITKEAGVPLATPYKKGSSAPERTSQRSTKQDVVQANSCSIQCVNGDCGRRWRDGRSERFRAPRVTNPFSGQLEWDTSGC